MQPKSNLGRTFLLAVSLWSIGSAKAQQHDLELPYQLGQGAIRSPAASPSGAYVTEVPLSLPSPRGDVQIPLTVRYEGNKRVGAAGVGWNIPLYSVKKIKSLSQRKPAHLGIPADPESKPASAARLFLELGSGPMMMAAAETPGVYRPLQSSEYIELREDGDSWVASDASGRHYLFERLENLEVDESKFMISSSLGDENQWYLSRITDKTRKNFVSLRYEVFDTMPPAPHEVPDFTIKELVLAEIAYSFEESDTCPKYRINLGYRHHGSTSPFPKYLDLRLEDGRLRSVTRTINSIIVWSKESSSCSESDFRKLRTYAFEYSEDADTGLPRLSSVGILGIDQDLAPSADILPVSEYAYGTATVSNQLRYGATKKINLESSAPPVFKSFGSSFVEGNFFVNPQSIADISGDGRADYVRQTLAGESLLRANLTEMNGNGFSTFPDVVSFADPISVITFGSPGISTSLANPAPTFTVIWQQLIDWNGDGRLDILNALNGKNPDGDPSPNYWSLLLNVPGPSNELDDIEWRQSYIDISYLRSEVSKFHNLDPGLPIFIDRHLPLSRSHSTYAINQDTGDREKSGRLTEWKLVDVNGDTFPDFVFNGIGTIAREREHCLDSSNCHDDFVFDTSDQNPLMAVYHTGPLMAGAATGAVSMWSGPALTLREDGRCGVERYEWGSNHTQHMLCGFVEINGDGVVDYLLEETRRVNNEDRFRRIGLRSSGLPQEIDEELPENITAWPLLELSRAIVMPGEINVIQSERSDSCPRNAIDGSLIVSPDTQYRTRQLSALRDITGDKIPDFVYFGTEVTMANGVPINHPSIEDMESHDEENGWWLMAGSRVGYREPQRIVTDDAIEFAIFETLEVCNGAESHVLASQIDMDGDGRLDLVRTDLAATVTISKTIGADGVPGNHSAGELIRDGNGYGAATLVSYTSAKNDRRTIQRLPYDQIVVDETRLVTEKGLGEPLEATRYAYGGAKLHYDPLMGKWVFPGYSRRIALQGESAPGTTERVSGVATITDLFSADELPAGYRRYALAGTVKNVSRLVGAFSSDPRLLLDAIIEFDFRRRGNRKFDFDIKLTNPDLTQGPILVSLNEECYDLNPYDPINNMGDLRLCKRSGIRYQSKLEIWNGILPFPSHESVATRSYIYPEDVDKFGRATRIYVENDRSVSEDDFCIETKFAEPQGDAAPGLTLVQWMRITDCKKSQVTYAGTRYVYDNLPEGSVSQGLITGVFVERYDVADGVLLDQYQSRMIEHGPFGNVENVQLLREDGVTGAVDFEYDDFGQLAIQSIATSSDTSTALSSSFAFDPVTNLPTLYIDPNGTQYRAYYDSLGRLTKSTVEIDDGVELVQVARQYLGDSPEDSQGRRQREVIFQDWTADSVADFNALISSESLSVTTSFFDEIGRLRYRESSLGDDYPAGSLFSDHTIYDGLGRAKFVADPYFSDSISSDEYGRTLVYRSDGRIKCVIQGNGLQDGSVATDSTSNRFPTCYDYEFRDHQFLVRTQGPNELDPASDLHGAYQQVAMSAVGQIYSASRWLGGARVEHATYRFDKLGQLAGITRFAAPDTLDGAVSWNIRNDSLGQPMTLEEPPSADRHFEYNRWGLIGKVWWTENIDGGTQERSIRSKYDGFGRLISTGSYIDELVIEGSSSEYFYDQQSTDSFHSGAQNLLGQLAYAVGPEMNIFFSYDQLGRRTKDTRVHRESGRSNSVQSQLRPWGETELLEFKLEGTAHQSEIVHYVFDSAQNIAAVDRTDANGTTRLFTAAEIDEFSRYRSIELGNNTELGFLFASSGRREIKQLKLSLGGQPVHTIDYTKFDGDMLLRESVVSTTSLAEQNVITNDYDSVDRLKRSTIVSSTGDVIEDFVFKYDGLGNLVQRLEIGGPRDIAFMPDLVDHDRVCRSFRPSPGPIPAPDFPVLKNSLFSPLISRNGSAVRSDRNKYKPDNNFNTGFSSLCDYRYDQLGNVAGTGVGSAAEKLVEYDGWARVSSISNGSAEMSIKYDPFGQVSSQIITGSTQDRNQKEVNYGPLVREVTLLTADGEPDTVNGSQVFGGYVDSVIPGPLGIVATIRRLDNGESVALYPFTPFSSTTRVSNETGETVRTTNVFPYGEIKSETILGEEQYLWNTVWNEGRTSREFGLTQLGARLYDGNSGRFLQRDPLLVIRNASNAHPYAFAWSNPIVFSDPSGLDPTCIGSECGGPGESLSDLGSLGVGSEGQGWAEIRGSANADPFAQYSDWFEFAQEKPCLACHLTREINRIPKNWEWDAGDLMANWSMNATIGGRILLRSTGVGALIDLGVGYFVFDESLTVTNVGATFVGLGGVKVLKVLKSGMTYRTRVDQANRLLSITAKVTPSTLALGTATTAAARRLAKMLGRHTDDAGHAIGKLLGGPGGAKSGNIFAQLLNINRGAFAKWEQEIANHVRSGATVYVRVVPQYIGSSTRATSVIYQARINGVTLTRVFGN